MKASRPIRQAGLFLSKNMPTILTIAGSVGVVLTAVTTANATVKAVCLVNEAECQKKDTLTKKEVFVTTAPSYIPPILIGSATIACVVASNLLNKRQQASLASAYMLLDTTFRDYKKKVVEMYGENADKDVKAELLKERYKEQRIVKIRTDETLLFYIDQYGQIFERTFAEVQDAEYQLNRKMAMDGEASVNDFFELLGLETNEVGACLGWDQEGICDFFMPPWIDFEHQLVRMEDGMECFIINFVTEPTPGHAAPF